MLAKIALFISVIIKVMQNAATSKKKSNRIFKHIE
jgi:hypothetical protein